MSKIGIQTHGVNQSIMRKGLRGGGIAKRGTGVALKGGGRIGKFGGGRTNLLEELGRVEGERSNPNRRAEISRVHGELNRGYAKGGRAGFSVGSSVGRHLKKGVGLLKEHLARKEAKKVQGAKDKIQKSEMGYAKGGRAGFRNGGSSMTEHYLEHGYGPHKKRKRKAVGGRIGLKHGFQVLGGGIKGKPHSTYEGRNEAGRRRFKRLIGEDPGKRNKDFVKRARRMARAGRGKDFKTHGRDVTTMAAEGG